MKLYRLFDSIRMHFSIISCMFLLYYVGVVVVFQVLVNAELAFKKDIKKKEEMKKREEKKKKVEIASFGSVAFVTSPCHVTSKFKYHGVRHGPVAFATCMQCSFSATTQNMIKSSHIFPQPLLHEFRVVHLLLPV